jgi:hypothetical protein
MGAMTGMALRVIWRGNYASGEPLRRILNRAVACLRR